ncbi:MAG: glycosyltransferase [Flavobacteriaceae bacterium]|nr:glycosyltransferase [Flavobacteriaceae bacterium]
MEITHVISSVDKNSGGTSTYMKLLIEALIDMVNQNLIAFDSNQNIKINGDVNCKFIKNKSKITVCNQELEDTISSVYSDIFHGNGLWQYPVHAMSKIALKKDKPFIISTHGMLEPWALQQGKFKKQLALKLFQYNDLAKATCLHATAPMEVESIRKLGLKNPIAMIPNGVNIEAFPTTMPVKATAPKKILFLSRIHHKKGIEHLIEAWSLLEINLRKNWIIEIVGNGEQAYIETLQQKINMHHLQEQILIKAPVFGGDKIKIFREASLFVLPTYSENFGIVIAEAMASYTPVITTKGTPWEELNTHNAGWWIDIGVEPLKNALIDAMQAPGEALTLMGKNGRKLIEDKYSMEAVASQMLELYEWVLKKGEKPKFIYKL